MTGEVLSAGLVGSPDAVKAEQEQAGAQSRRDPVQGEWDLGSFARAQIRGMVRRLFFTTPERPVRQVVFTALEPQTDLHSICKSVGEALALETQGRVAVAGVLPEAVAEEGLASRPDVREGTPRSRRVASRVQANLWLLAGPEKKSASALGLHQYLSQIRGEFEFSIVTARAADWFEAIAMSQFADGVVLVLSAQHSRRITARRMKEALEGSRARLLGTVLADRLFPLPESIYRRL